MDFVASSDSLCDSDIRVVKAKNYAHSLFSNPNQVMLFSENQPWNNFFFCNVFCFHITKATREMQFMMVIFTLTGTERKLHLIFSC